MKLKYDVSKQDYIDFNINFVETSPVMKRSLLVQRFMFPMIFLLLPHFLKLIVDIPFMVIMGTFIGVSIFWVLFYVKWYKHKLSRQIVKFLDSGRATGILGPHELELGDGYLSDKTADSVTRYDVVEQILETPKHIFVYVNQVMAYILPKKTFKSQMEIDEFMMQLQAYKRK